jgi:hypothetical protein
MGRRVQKRGHCELINGSYYRVVIVRTYPHITIESLIQIDRFSNNNHKTLERVEVSSYHHKAAWKRVYKQRVVGSRDTGG